MSTLSPSNASTSAASTAEPDYALARPPGQLTSPIHECVQRNQIPSGGFTLPKQLTHKENVSGARAVARTVQAGGEVRRLDLGITPVVHSWLDRLTTLVSETPEELAFAAVLVPIVLAIFSKRPIAIWGSTLLAIITLCVFVAPSNSAAVLATGVYLGSLILALSSIVSRRKGRALQAEVASLRKDMDRLRGDVTMLSHAEQRRFMRELNKQSDDVPASGRDLSPKGSDTDPNQPAK